MFWFVDEENDLSVCHIPRCGSKCIRGWMGKKTRMVQDDNPCLMEITRRVAFVRHPIERLKSTYWLFYWMLVNDGIKHLSGFPVESWEIFVDHVLNGSTPYDEHVLPQYDHIKGIANIYHRYENLHQKFEIYKPGILPDRGRTTKKKVNTAYRLNELVTFYAHDFALWMEAD